MTEEPLTETCKYCFKKTERTPEGECTHCHFAHPDFLLPPEEHDDEWIRDARAILRGIAERSPIIGRGVVCWFCRDARSIGKHDWLHASDCLWLRARKLVGVK